MLCTDSLISYAQQLYERGAVIPIECNTERLTNLSKVTQPISGEALYLRASLVVTTLANESYYQSHTELTKFSLVQVLSKQK